MKYFALTNSVDNGISILLYALHYKRGLQFAKSNIHAYSCRLKYIVFAIEGPLKLEFQKFGRDVRTLYVSL